ncbi:MAG: AAA family ATPase [Candidatus Diapherotrites archaeon]|nr:AAA family ATPase [Candidatus Diapherotrites archaeon]
MANPFEKSDEKGILKDERYLYPEFVPERLPFREREISELVFALKPATMGRKPGNIFVSGFPGTGKTVTLKYVLHELEEFSDRAKCVYINCFEKSTRNGILVKTVNSLGYPVPERGLGSEEVYERLVALLKSKKVIPIIVFDEAEQLLKTDDSKKLLYDFSRLGEEKGLFLGMVFISNDAFFLSAIDERVRSSLQASHLSFEKYSPIELKEILKERAQYAFFGNALENEVIPLCAAHAAKNGGDARIAITVLLKAARLAERENAKQVQLKHVRASFMQEKPVKFEIAENLSEQEFLVLNFVAGGEVDAGAVYKALGRKFSERTLRKAVSDLEGKGILRARRVQKGRGFTRLISKAAR